MAGSYVTLNPAAIDRMLNGPDGFVMRSMFLRGERVHALARSKVRPSRVRVGREGAAAWSKDVSLRDAGSVEYARLPGVGGVVLVRFKKRYAYFVDQGTRPHVIRPKRGKALAFYWNRVGTDVVLKSVKHPGYKGNRFLSGSVHAAASDLGSASIATFVHPVTATDVSPADLRGVA